MTSHKILIIACLCSLGIEEFTMNMSVLFKRNHTDEKSFGNEPHCTFQDSTIKGGDYNRVGTKPQIIIAWLDAIYDSYPVT